MFLNIPITTWLMQIGYVIVALGLYALLLRNLPLGANGSLTKVIFSIGYIVVMIAVNIIWRLAIK